MRPAGTPSTVAVASAPASSAAWRSTGIQPGATMFTVMPEPASSRAVLSARPVWPPFGGDVGAEGRRGEGDDFAGDVDDAAPMLLASCAGRHDFIKQHGALHEEVEHRLEELPSRTLRTAARAGCRWR